MSNVAAGTLQANARQSRRGEIVRNARLVTGLVMMAFVTTHLINHALALISIELADAARPFFMSPWQNPVGLVALAGSMLVHIGLAFDALYRRRSLSAMTYKELAQLILGLAIPVMLVEHVTGTGIYGALSGVRINYEFVVKSLWEWIPWAGVRQTVAVLVVWIHGCLGLFFWLRYRSWFAHLAPLLLVLATALPILAVLGFVNAGRAVEGVPFTGADGVDQATIAAALETRRRIMIACYSIYGAAVALVFILRFLRSRREHRNIVEVRYPDGKSVKVPRGYSLLEASRIAGIPHHSACGGRGRCSTCRARVLEHDGSLPAPGPLEQTTLTRIRAQPDVRLACQLRPAGNVKIAPLLDASSITIAPRLAANLSPGQEREVAVLFCDIRSFTALSDRRLPFDTVFLLNRYFAAVGRSVEEADGRLDKFIGDGAMAIFGLETSKEQACRQAIGAAGAILEEIRKLSRELSGELSQPLRLAIGIHAGPAIAGEMGYGRTTGVTVIGDTVNVASRLESVAKELNAALVVSDEVLSLAGLRLHGAEGRTVDIRGRSRPLSVHVAQDARIVTAAEPA